MLDENVFVHEELVKAARYLRVTPCPQRNPQHSADETTARFSAFARSNVDRFGDTLRYGDRDFRTSHSMTYSIPDYHTKVAERESKPEIERGVHPGEVAAAEGLDMCFT